MMQYVTENGRRLLLLWAGTVLKKRPPLSFTRQIAVRGAHLHNTFCHTNEQSQAAGFGSELPPSSSLIMYVLGSPTRVPYDSA